MRPVSSTVGAEIGGVDLARPLSADTVDEIRHALFEFGVVFFRDQEITPEQHVAFAQRFGEINVNRFFKPVNGYPMIAEVRKDSDHHLNIGGNWHTDHSYDVAPAMGSLLYAREVPETGGDTLFASMYAAYDALSDGLKETIESLHALHSSRHVFGVATYAQRQSELHRALRRMERRRVTAAVAAPLPARGPRDRSPSGTTVAPGTTRSTTIRASGASCTGSPSRACR